MPCRASVKSRGFTWEEDEEVEVPDVADRRITGKKWPLVPLIPNYKNIFSSYVSERVHN